MRTLSRVCGITVLLTLWSMNPLLAQSSPKRVTAVTVKGDVVEGVLKSATETTITVEVAGQPIQLPIDTLQYVSFIGPLAARGASAAASALNPMEAAFAAIAELQSAAQVGVLRPQWNDRLLAAVPRIRAFTESSREEWSDVKAALEMAVYEYQFPLNSVSSWQYGDMYFRAGGRAAAYAKELAAVPAERTHKETPSPEGRLSFDTPVSGRLGFGDATLADGAYVETYVLSVSAKSDVALDLECTPGSCEAVVRGADAKPINGRPGFNLKDPPGRKFKKSLMPGVYKVQVTTSRPREVGTYKLTASVVK